MKEAHYRKYNDRSLNSSKYHKLDGTAVRAKLKAELQKETKETRYNNSMNDLHKADQAKIKQLKQFQKAFDKLMQKYPAVNVYGNMDGDVCGYVSLAFPTLDRKNNNIRLTYQGKVIQ
jgi:hypothetical protein